MRGIQWCNRINLKSTYTCAPFYLTQLHNYSNSFFNLLTLPYYYNSSHYAPVITQSTYTTYTYHEIEDCAHKIQLSKDLNKTVHDRRHVLLNCDVIWSYDPSSQSGACKVHACADSGIALLTSNHVHNHARSREST